MIRRLNHQVFQFHPSILEEKVTLYGDLFLLLLIHHILENDLGGLNIYIEDPLIML